MWRPFVSRRKRSPLFEIALVLVRFDHIAGYIINANHRTVCAAEKLCVIDSVVDRVELAIPQPTEWQHIGN